jgi:hypothetical protein
VAEDIVSDTRFKLQEAEYFLEQMKNNVDNYTHFAFNLSAFVSAARSVTLVMQYQYKIRVNTEESSSIWYRENVEEVLRRHEDAKFFNELRIKFIHLEGNPRQDVRTIVRVIVIGKYDIIGSTPENEEEERKLSQHNSKQESSPPPQQPTQPLPPITDKPEDQDLMQKYVWYIEDIMDKSKKNRKYVIPTCEKYLQILSGGVDNCERHFSG